MPLHLLWGTIWSPSRILVITRAPFGWWGEQGGTERVGGGAASKGSGKCGQEIGEGGGLVAGMGVWGERLWGGSGLGGVEEWAGGGRAGPGIPPNPIQPTPTIPSPSLR